MLSAKKESSVARKDQEKWDRKYLENPQLRAPRPPVRWLELLHDRKSGLALDLACGTGRNAIALARLGWEVEAVDLSSVALQILAQEAERAGVAEKIRPEKRDLDDFEAPDERYDLILIANYLDRDLIRRILPAVKPGGILIVETYMRHPENEKPESTPDYLLRAGELPELLGSGFEILHYEEFWNEGFEMYRMRKAAIVGEKKRLSR
jgi:SAM-dependent methyltransferase